MTKGLKETGVFEIGVIVRTQSPDPIPWIEKILARANDRTVQLHCDDVRFLAIMLMDIYEICDKIDREDIYPNLTDLPTTIKDIIENGPCIDNNFEIVRVLPTESDPLIQGLLSRRQLHRSVVRLFAEMLMTIYGTCDVLDSEDLGVAMMDLPSIIKRTIEKGPKKPHIDISAHDDKPSVFSDGVMKIIRKGLSQIP